MKTKIFLCKVSEVPKGRFLIRDVNRKSIGVGEFLSQIKVIWNYCPHEGAEICKGFLRNMITSKEINQLEIDETRGVLVCPWHKWEFDWETGLPIIKGVGKVLQYDFTIEEDELFIYM